MISIGHEKTAPQTGNSDNYNHSTTTMTTATKIIFFNDEQESQSKLKLPSQENSITAALPSHQTRHEQQQLQHSREQPQRQLSHNNGSNNSILAQLLAEISPYEDDDEREVNNSRSRIEEFSSSSPSINYFPLFFSSTSSVSLSGRGHHHLNQHRYQQFNSQTTLRPLPIRSLSSIENLPFSRITNVQSFRM